MVGFIELEKVYDRVNRETLWQVIRIYDVGGQVSKGIENVYINILGCLRVKVKEN